MPKDIEVQDMVDSVFPSQNISSQLSNQSVHSELSTDASYEEKCQILRMSSTESGPNSFKKQSSFGGTIKLKPSKAGESSIAIEQGNYYSHAEKVDKWQKYSHLGETKSRVNIVDSFGVLMVPPGPSDYKPKTENRSTQRTDPHWSFYDRDKYKGSVDALNSPGPGTYLVPTSIIPKEPYVVRQEKTKLVTAMDKIGPGSYNVRRTAEMATQRFHRETSAHLAKRDSGSKTRETLDFNTLRIKKNKQKRVKNAQKTKIKQSDDDKSHLGPGAYFPLPSEVPASICTSPNKTLPNRRKCDHDPNIPSTHVHTFGVRRDDFHVGKDENTPGPGEYDYLASLYGTQPLLEAGGAVSRPGKTTHNTSDSEGTVKGQHANLDFATKYIPALPTMRSAVTVNGHTSSGKWVSNSEQMQQRANAYTSPYATTHKKVDRIQRLVGRGSESTAQDLTFRFSGRQSTGAFFKFH